MLNISELVKRREDTREYWKKKYNIILEDCHKKIKYYARHNYTNCFFEVPESRFGLPVYDIYECLHYIIMKLKRNGFELQVIGNKIISIDWGKYVSEEPTYIKTANEVKKMEHMKALPAPAPIKSNNELSEKKVEQEPRHRYPSYVYNHRPLPVRPYITRVEKPLQSESNNRKEKKYTKNKMKDIDSKKEKNSMKSMTKSNKGSSRRVAFI